MATDYANERREAAADLKEDGASVTLHSPGETVEDGATGDVTTVPGADVLTFGILRDYSTREIDGTVIMRGDMQLIASAEELFTAGLVPNAGWAATVPIHGKLRVMRASPVAPGGVAVLWKLQLRT